MTLPSNSSMKVFPDNTLTTYKTLLPEYVSASTPLECALQEITCPTSWYNVLPENILLIEGINVEDQATPQSKTKRLHQALTKNKDTFFSRSENGEPLLSRTPSSHMVTIVKDCLVKGVELTRHQNVHDSNTPNRVASSEVDDSINADATGTPSGGTATNQGEGANPAARGEEETEEKEAKEEAKEAAKEEEAKPPYKVLEMDIKFRESRDISPAVAAVRRLYSSRYTEVGTVIGSPETTLTAEEMIAVKATLKMKALDKLVNTFKFPARRSYRVFSLPGAFLVNNGDLIHFLNKIFNRKNPLVVKALREHYTNNKSLVFNYNRYTLKCIVSLPPNVVLQLPVNLAQQLGFGPGVFLVGKTESRSVVDVMFRADTVYVYSDIVKHSIVGDKRAPLLRVVNVNPLVGETQTVTFQPLIYQPVNKSSFRQITLYLRDRTGQPIPFERGAVTVVLAFRPVNNLQH